MYVCGHSAWLRPRVKRVKVRLRIPITGVPTQHLLPRGPSGNLKVNRPALLVQHRNTATLSDSPGGGTPPDNVDHEVVALLNRFDGATTS
jgi:hypothetical protein